MRKAVNSTILTSSILLFALAAWAGLNAAFIASGNWSPATCISQGCFCENVHPQWPVQPVNSWSSLAFLIPAVVVLYDRRIPTSACFYSSGASFRTLFGVSLVTIALGSAFYHATLSLVGQTLDVLGMYLLISLAVLSCLADQIQAVKNKFLPVYLSVNVLLVVLLVIWPEVRREIFAGLVISLLFVEIWRMRSPSNHLPARWFWIGLLTLAAAYTIWILDNLRILCDPGSILQGHAAWHFLGAAAAWFLYRYYRSDLSAASLETTQPALPGIS